MAVRGREVERVQRAGEWWGGRWGEGGRAEMNDNIMRAKEGTVVGMEVMKKSRLCIRDGSCALLVLLFLVHVGVIFCAHASVATNRD